MLFPQREAFLYGIGRFRGEESLPSGSVTMRQKLIFGKEMPMVSGFSAGPLPSLKRGDMP